MSADSATVSFALRRFVTFKFPANRGGNNPVVSVDVNHSSFRQEQVYGNAGQVAFVNQICQLLVPILAAEGLKLQAVLDGWDNAFANTTYTAVQAVSVFFEIVPL